MALRSPKLTAARRRSLPASAFGLPETGQYPLDTPGLGVAAKGRATQQVDEGNLSPRAARPDPPERQPPHSGSQARQAALGLDMGMTRHWISCARFTVEVETDDAGRIMRAAPIVRRFEGQMLDRLLACAAHFGGLKHEVLTMTPPPSCR